MPEETNEAGNKGSLDEVAVTMISASLIASSNTRLSSEIDFAVCCGSLNPSMETFGNLERSEEMRDDRRRLMERLNILHEVIEGYAFRNKEICASI